MKTLLRLLLLAVLASSALAVDFSYNGVKPDFIIDVRTVGEFQAGHIDGALNIPVDQIEQGVAGIKGIKPDSKILLYCRSGRRSGLAEPILEKSGFRVHQLEGSWQAWQAAGLPEEKTAAPRAPSATQAVSQ